MSTISREFLNSKINYDLNTDLSTVNSLEEAETLLEQLCIDLDSEQYDLEYDLDVSELPGSNIEFYDAVYKALAMQIFPTVAKKAADLGSVKGMYLYGSGLDADAYCMDQRTRDYKETTKESMHYLRMAVYKGCYYSIRSMVGVSNFFASPAEEYAFSIFYYEREKINYTGYFDHLSESEKKAGIALYNDMKEAGFKFLNYQLPSNFQ
ncbi:hypothetical protein H0A36_24150 [Endozoicomonas sp. SM1973]|uniref:Uncharacterized protein n=1 Tax=Spartinivicinus marinus TaxID=2994442 RepID=A0A853II82_9GAMM|nr:hypothetical protein [Spartinivicinus marinus]NYZ69117.1 hypothetical protein [Spartinivicinus marinus]